MGRYRFKSNIKCNGCLQAIAPSMNGNKRITRWDVDLQHPDRIMTVETSNMNEEEFINLVQRSGYTIEKV